MTAQTNHIQIHSGDRDNTDSYVVVVLSKQEIANFSKDMFSTEVNPYEGDEAFWRHLSQKVGSALWALYAISHEGD